MAGIRHFWHRWGFILALAGFIATRAGAQVALDEQVVSVPKHGLFTLQLETTLYRPPGAGPFPLVVINHGKAPGDARAQGRYQPARAARFFVQRGYAVAVPMRQGFSRSEGSYIGGGCNVESNGRVQADDVRATLDYLTAQPWIDPTRILVVGQSHGGWTTLAFGTLRYPGVRGLVNFAGGLRQNDCVNWEGGLARAAAAYAHDTTVPSLWFYGDNDSYFTPYTAHLMYDSYTAAGGHAELVSFGTFGNDAHMMFPSAKGEPIWQPRVEDFMRSVGLPTQVVYPQYAPPAPMPVPPATGFARVDDAEAVPYLKDTGREGYRQFLAKPVPRAFAVAPGGSWGWATGGDDPLARALANCSKSAKQPCRLYAVDDATVWVKENTTP